ncbi:MAG: hypothetical protein ABFD00_10395 [Chloroherpetonaceae bacterium]
MNDFEIIYNIEQKVEKDFEREKKSIELSDTEFLNKLIDSREMDQVGFIYQEVIPNEKIPRELKEKFELARKICLDTQIIDLRPSNPVSLKSEIPELEKDIKEGKKNAKSKDKTVKTKTKKVNSRTNKTTMESI